jgi:hypothetical protein
MKQVSVQLFETENKKVKIYVDNDTALGDLHDFLLNLKGNIIDRMVKAQKEESEQAEAMKELENSNPECSTQE